MIVNLEQVKVGVSNFIDREIGAKAVGKMKFAVYFFAPLIVQKATKYIVDLKSFAPELFDENNNIDLDKLYGMAKEAIKKSGQFEMAGIFFNESDVDRLYSYIKHTDINTVV